MTLYTRTGVDIDFVIMDPDTLQNADPDEIHYRWREPDGTFEDRQYGQGGAPAVEKIAVGHYRVTVDTTDKGGRWDVLCYSIGTPQGSEKASFLIVDPWD